MARPGVELTAAESYELLWELDGAEAKLWDLRQMAMVGGEKAIGPGALLQDPHERFRLAQKTALSLLDKGLVAVCKGPEPWESGETLPLADARHELKKGNNWLLPGDRERDTYFWLELTSKGENMRPSIRREDIPTIEAELFRTKPA